jgi:hypothetical protein
VPARLLIAAGEADVEASIRTTRSATQRTPLSKVLGLLHRDDTQARAVPACRGCLTKHPPGPVPGYRLR